MQSPHVSITEIDINYRPPTWYLSQIIEFAPDKVIQKDAIYYIDKHLFNKEAVEIIELIKYFGLTYNEAIRLPSKDRTTFRYLYPERLRIGGFDLIKDFAIVKTEYPGGKKTYSYDDPAQVDCYGNVIPVREKPSSMARGNE